MAHQKSFFALAMLSLAAVLVLITGCSGAKSANSVQKENTANQGVASALQQNAKGAVPVSENAKSGVNEKKLQKVKLGVPAKSLTFLPQYLGAAEGIYQRDGLEVEVIEMKANLNVSSLISGDLDFSAAGGSIIRAAVTGVPVKLVMFSVLDTPFTMVAPQGIKSVEDLRGKVIGGNSFGSGEMLTARAIIRHFKLDPDRDVKYAMLETTANQLAALQSGVISAAVLSPPYDYRATQMGFKPLVFAPDVVESSAPTGLGTSVEKIQKNPQLITAMIKSELNSLQYIRKERAKTVKFIKEQWGLADAEADAVYDTLIRVISPDGGSGGKSINNAVKEAASQAKIEKVITEDDVVDLSILKTVQKELGL